MRVSFFFLFSRADEARAKKKWHIGIIGRGHDLRLLILAKRQPWTSLALGGKPRFGVRTRGAIISISSRADNGYPPSAVVAVVTQNVFRVSESPSYFQLIQKKMTNARGDGHDWNWLSRCQGKKNFEWSNDELLGKAAYFIWRGATRISLMNFLNEC